MSFAVFRLFSELIFFSLLIHCRNYDGFPGRVLRDDVITVTVNYGNSSNANLGWWRLGGYSTHDEDGDSTDQEAQQLADDARGYS